MKKIIALILAFAIVLPCLILAEDASVNDFAVSKEIQLLQAIGIIEKADYDKNPQDIMTRAEFAMTIIKLYGREDVAMGMYDAKYFTDVEPDYEETGYINTAAKSGIILPVNADRFEPKSPVTAGVAAKAFAYILGYGALVDASDDPFETATNMLMKGGLAGLVKYEPDAVLTRGEIFDMIEDAVDAELFIAEYMTKKSGTNNIAVEYKADSKETILSYYHNVYKNRGVISANEKTSLTSASGAVGEDKVVISGYTYDDKQGLLDEYLGYYVDFYWQLTDDETYDILIAWSERTETLEIDPYDITSAVNMRMTYVDKKDKLETVDLRGLYVIYNGVATSQNVNFKPESGSVTLIDNTGDGKWDIVKIISYTELIYNKASNDKTTLYGEYNKNINLKDVDKVTVINADTGLSTSIDAITEGAIVSGFTAPDGKSAEIFFSTATIEGTLSQVGGADPNRIKINDTEYTVSQTLKKHITDGNIGDFAFGGTFKYYLNFDGNIANYSRVSDIFTDYEVAFLMAAAPEGGLSDTVRVKLYTQYNLEFSCTLSKKVIIDDARPNGMTDALNKLKKLGEDGTVGTAVVPQLIRCKMDDKNVITHIDMAASAPDGNDGLYIMYNAPVQGALKYYSGARGFVDSNYSPLFAMTPSVQVFAVDASSASGVNGSTKITYTTVPSAFISGKEYGDFIMYGFDEEKIEAGVVVRFAPPAANIESVDPYCMVVDIMKALGEDGTPKNMIEYTIDGVATKTAIVSDDIDLTRVKYKNYAGTEYEYALSKGDIFRYSQDLSGEITRIELIYSCAGEKILLPGNSESEYSKAVYPSSPTAAVVQKIGGILRLDDSFMEYSYDAPSVASIKGMAFLDTLFEKQGAAIVYNKTHEDFRKISKAELLDYETVKDECSKGILVIRSLTSRFIFLYED